MDKRQYYGIKYPFTSDGFQKFYVDTNANLKDKVRSQLMHVIFTPKLQRIRMPEFGTNLIKYIFEPNEDVAWEAVKNEVSDSVSRWVNNVKLKDISVMRNENDPSEIYVRIDYTVSEGNKVTNDSIGVQL